jgi:hypothetical protein
LDSSLDPSPSSFQATAVAYFKFHAPQGFWPLLNDGEGAVLYCFIFLFLASASGGPWSFDRLSRKSASTVWLIFALTSGSANKKRSPVVGKPDII